MINEQSVVITDLGDIIIEDLPVVLVRWVDSVHSTDGWTFENPDSELNIVTSVGILHKASEDRICIVPNVSGDLNALIPQTMGSLVIPFCSVKELKLLAYLHSS